MIVPQLLVVVSLIGFAYGLIWSFVPPSIVALSALLILSLLEGYRQLSENDKLNDTRAFISVKWQKVHPYFWPQWGYRIGVWNEGPAAADHVEVMLDSISPQPTMDSNVLPALLGHKDGYCTGDHCSINKGREHSYDLLNRRSTPGVWGLLTVVQTRIVLLEGLSYIFDVVLSARNQRGTAVHVLLEVHQRSDGWLDLRVLSGEPSTAIGESTQKPSHVSTPDRASTPRRSTP